MRLFVNSQHFITATNSDEPSFYWLTHLQVRRNLFSDDRPLSLTSFRRATLPAVVSPVAVQLLCQFSRLSQPLDYLPARLRSFRSCPSVSSNIDESSGCQSAYTGCRPGQCTLSAESFSFFLSLAHSCTATLVSAVDTLRAHTHQNSAVESASALAASDSRRHTMCLSLLLRLLPVLGRHLLPSSSYSLPLSIHS